MSNKLSEQIQNAYMLNDQVAIEEVTQQISEKQAAVGTTSKTTPMQVHTVLNDENSSAIELNDFMDKILGEDWWELEYETIERILWVRFGTALEEINRDKLWAVKHLCNSNRPYLDWAEFNQIAIAFGGAISDFEDLKKPTPGMAITTMKQMPIIHPGEQFSFEVKKYICILLYDSGIYCPPPSIFELIKEEFSELVSKEMKDSWSMILTRYNDYIKNNKPELSDDNPVDIQAKRLVIAEEAASEYGR